MQRHKLLLVRLVGAVLVFAAWGSVSRAQEFQPVKAAPQLSASELAAAEPLVVGHCSACHSLELVTAQRGDAKFWLNTIRWMQRTQKLWEIPADQERKVIAYLSQVYAEEDAGRRPLLPLSLQHQDHWQK